MIYAIFVSLGFAAFIIFLYVHCFKKIKKMSALDASDITCAERLVANKYSGSISDKQEAYHI